MRWSGDTLRVEGLAALAVSSEIWVPSDKCPASLSLSVNQNLAS